jgi:hypothetical protein
VNCVTGTVHERTECALPYRCPSDHDVFHAVVKEFPLLQQLLNALGAPLVNWREIVGVIDAEFANAKTVESRVVLLAAFKAAMDEVEATAPQFDFETIHAVRLLRYDALLMREALDAEGACAETLDRIAKREIAAGRMASDSELRKIAKDGLERLRQESTRDAKRPNPWARARASLVG